MDHASEMSDSVFPVAFIRNGTELSSGRRPDELEVMLRGQGMQRLVCIDMDSIEAQGSILSTTAIANLDAN